MQARKTTRWFASVSLFSLALVCASAAQAKDAKNVPVSLEAAVEAGLAELARQDVRVSVPAQPEAKVTFNPKDIAAVAPAARANDVTGSLGLPQLPEAHANFDSVRANPPLTQANLAPAAEPIVVAPPAVDVPKVAEPAKPAAPVAPVQSASIDPATANPAAAVVSPYADALKAALAASSRADIRGSYAAVARKDREAVNAYYAKNGFAPLWLSDGKWSDAAKAVVARLQRAREDGLELSGFRLPTLGDTKDVAAALAADIDLSEAVVAYGRQASGARIDPRRISALITVTMDVPDAARVLDTVVAAKDANEALEAFNPRHPGYVALREKLNEMRNARAPVAKEKIPFGPTLKVGMSDPRVPLIRAHFGINGDDAAKPQDSVVYDTRVAGAVADFQRANGLPASGTLTPRTITLLSGGEPSRLENEILANMERWRWMPRKLGDDRIEVNIPDYSLKMTRGAEITHRTRVVVGKPNTPTPVFSHQMQFIIVNPYWNVPPSIIKKEMMPKFAADPTYFSRRGYEVIQRKGQIIVRQPPGASNALGRIKFMFPNDHSVYLHDTSARSLFALEKRAFSHGCVRVDKPFGLAEAVLGRENGWSEARVQKMIGGGERTLNLPKPLPIHIQYFTTFVDENGRLQLRDDLYGYSAKVKAALGLEG